jgi:Holliday junction resolvase RusA-like endonuclease
MGAVWTPMQGPLVLHTRFWLPRPKGAPKTIDIRPTKKPDIDKVLRATMDALTASGLWLDDAQVVESHEYKFYSVSPDLHRIYRIGWHRPPGARIEVTTLDG